MNKRAGLIVLAIVLLTIGGAMAVLYSYRQPAPSTKPPVQTDRNNTFTPMDAGKITVIGKVECLPHKDTSGPTDMMCALGLEAEDGTHYALSSDDPTFVGSVPTGQRVQITGAFTPQESRYNSPGAIKIASLQRL